jgi:hypothetical protein
VPAPGYVDLNTLRVEWKKEEIREVAGASTKGRYDQRLPSVSFALGLIYV